MGGSMHKIFFIHGMGNHKVGWAEDVIQQIGDQYNKYGISKRRGKFGSRFKCIPITYNNFFEKYLEEWRAHSKDLKAWGKIGIEIDNPMVTRMTEIASKGPGNDFLTTHVGDVLLYMLTDIREQVKVNVATQIMNELKNDAGDGWSIISHSLGTRVMTDTLQMLYTEQNLNFRRDYGKANLIATIANVSNLLQKLSASSGNQEGDVYRNAVYPGKKIEGACYRWINTAHELDPFLWAWPFVPPANIDSNPGWRTAFIRGLYKDIRLTARDITGTNPHDLGHYLRYPDVHQAIFQALEDADDESIFAPLELEHERQDYYSATLPEQTLKDVREHLEALKQQDISTVESLLNLWEKFGRECQQNG